MKRYWKFSLFFSFLLLSETLQPNQYQAETIDNILSQGFNEANVITEQNRLSLLHNQRLEQEHNQEHQQQHQLNEEQPNEDQLFNEEQPNEDQLNKEQPNEHQLNEEQPNEQQFIYEEHQRNQQQQQNQQKQQLIEMQQQQNRFIVQNQQQRQDQQLPNFYSAFLQNPYLLLPQPVQQLSQVEEVRKKKKGNKLDPLNEQVAIDMFREIKNSFSHETLMTHSISGKKGI